MNPKLSRLLFILALACFGFPSVAPGLNIRIRYDHHGGLFPPGSEARVALRAVCDFYEEIITDRMGAIDPTQFGGVAWQGRYSDPSTGQLRIFTAPSGSTNIIIPENDFFLFAGSQNFAGNIAGLGGGTEFAQTTNYGPWVAQVIGRGEPGAGTTTVDHALRTDYAPWGGIVAFDLDRTWDFSLDQRGSSGATSFIAVALHEVAHALGFGTSPSFNNHIVNGTFSGPATRIAYANSTGPRNVRLSDASHFRDDGASVCTEPGGFGSNGVANTLSRTIDLFGTPGNRTQQVLMDSSTCVSTEYHQVMTRVDLAALKDIGWNVIERIAPETLDLAIEKPLHSAAAPPVFTFVTQPDYVYTLQRSDNLLVWEDTGLSVTGNGSTKSLSDPEPLHGGCTYRIAISAPEPVVAKTALPVQLPKFNLPSFTKNTPLLKSLAANICADCDFHTHDYDHSDGGDTE